MKIIFLIYHGFSDISGVSKKILFQIKALRELGHQVYTCTYTINEDGHRVRKIDNEIITDYGTGKWAAIKKRIDYRSISQYAIENNIDLVYIRSFHNANPFTIRFFKDLRKAEIKIVLEIPTYPYDLEYVGFPLRTRIGLYIDKLFRHQLAKWTNYMVTYSEDKTIFGQHTISISNGVDFDAIPLKKEKVSPTNELHLIGVAEVHYWHGFDRVIHGLGLYYQQPRALKVYFHIVGGIGPSEMYDSQHAPGFNELIKQYQIEEYVLFHGQQFGNELDQLFDNSDLAIGSLARHRSHITYLKTLKNREYAARGIPFIYSEMDDDFEKMPYVRKAPADETPVDIQQLIRFYESRAWKAEDIRTSIAHLSWKEQMNKVIQSLK